MSGRSSHRRQPYQSPHSSALTHETPYRSKEKGSRHLRVLQTQASNVNSVQASRDTRLRVRGKVERFPFQQKVDVIY